MGFLRRLFGSGDASATGEDTEVDEAGKEGDAPEPEVDIDASERAHELDLLRGEQERLDELTQRQLRYADYAWQPPAQGGERRADDEDSTSGGR